jgi:imidazolonepropionase-like amidohydrolase
MSDRTILLPDRVIDSEAGEVLTGRAVIVESERIVGVPPAADAPQDARAIDLAGHTLLAGLSDMHAHLVGMEDSGQGYASLVTRSGAQEALGGVKNARTTLGRSARSWTWRSATRSRPDGSKDLACCVPAPTSRVRAGEGT